MPARIRLQRHGKKGQPFYHIVVADGRAPRDGRFIEKIGTYNPLTNPATIVLNFDRAFYWVNCGVQPSDTVRSLLKREGIYMKKHLMGGVQKGAFTEAEAEAKLEAWKTDKTRRLSEKKLEQLNTAKSEKKKRFDAEVKVREAKEAIVNEKRLAELEQTRKKQEEAEAAAAAEAQKEEAEAVEAAQNQEEEVVAETAEQPEAIAETPQEEPTEETQAEEEQPAAE